MDAQAQLYQQLKHRIVDLENGDERPRKRPCRNKRTEGASIDSVDFTPHELEARARRIGRKYVILCGPFINTGSGDIESFVNTPLDADYDPQTRFSSDDDIRQGQLRELQDILTEELEPFFTRSWFAKAVCHSFSFQYRSHDFCQFLDGMKSQCSNTHTRLRGALELLMPDMAVADLHTADKRFAAFRNSIGWRERRRRYSIWDVPILHGNSSSEVDFNELFRHPMLLKVRW